MPYSSSHVIVVANMMGFVLFGCRYILRNCWSRRTKSVTMNLNPKMNIRIMTMISVGRNKGGILWPRRRISNINLSLTQNA